MCAQRMATCVCFQEKRACATRASKMHIRRGLEDPLQREGDGFGAEPSCNSAEDFVCVQGKGHLHQPPKEVHQQQVMAS